MMIKRLIGHLNNMFLIVASSAVELYISISYFAPYLWEKERNNNNDHTK